VSHSADSRPPETSDRRSALRTSMLLVGALVAGMSVLYLPTSLMSQTKTQAGPPIVRASDKWITLGVDASGSQVPTALSQHEVSQSKQANSRPQLSGRPVRSRVASAYPSVTQRGASDMPNCASNRRPAASFRVARAKGNGSRPATLA